MEARGDVKCLVCKFTVSSNLYDEKVIQYTVKFNAVQTTKVDGGEGLPNTIQMIEHIFLGP